MWYPKGYRTVFYLTCAYSPLPKNFILLCKFHIYCCSPCILTSELLISWPFSLLRFWYSHLSLLYSCYRGNVIRLIWSCQHSTSKTKHKVGKVPDYSLFILENYITTKISCLMVLQIIFHFLLTIHHLGKYFRLLMSIQELFIVYYQGTFYSRDDLLKPRLAFKHGL